VGDRLFFLGVLVATHYSDERGHINIESTPTTDVPVLVTRQFLNLGIVFKAHTVIETIEDFLKRKDPGSFKTNPEPKVEEQSESWFVDEIEITDELINEAMQRAEKLVCPPLDQRCYDFAYRVENALASQTPSEWCHIGWVKAESGRKVWDAWYNQRGQVSKVPPSGSRVEIDKVTVGWINDCSPQGNASFNLPRLLLWSCRFPPSVSDTGRFAAAPRIIAWSRRGVSVHPVGCRVPRGVAMLRAYWEGSSSHENRSAPGCAEAW
jgi:hypothetical protein